MSKKNGFRHRFDFSKIPATIQIPNLIEVQKRSYERFLQMDRLPSERDDGGLQSVFQSVFPITDFRNVSQLEFVDYAIGNWECKCGHLKGLHHLRTTCRNCGNTVITDPFHPGEVLCGKCGTYNANTVGVAAGYAMLTKVLTDDVYPRLSRLNQMLIDGYNEALRTNGIKGYAVGAGCNGTVQFAPREVKN